MYRWGCTGGPKLTKHELMTESPSMERLPGGRAQLQWICTLYALPLSHITSDITTDICRILYLNAFSSDCSLSFFSQHTVIHQSAILGGFDSNASVYSKTSAVLASNYACGQGDHVRQSLSPWLSKAQQGTFSLQKPSNQAQGLV